MSTTCESIDEYNITRIRRTKRKEKRIRMLENSMNKSSMHERKAPKKFSFDLRIERSDVDIDIAKYNSFDEAKNYLDLIFHHYPGYIGIEYIKV